MAIKLLCISEIVRKNYKIVLIALAITISTQNTTDASTEAASHFIHDLGHEALTILSSKDGTLDQREELFRNLLGDSFDLPFIARFTLGRHWRRASPTQKSIFQEVFGKYVLRTYSIRFGGYAGETMDIISAQTAGKKDILVHTRINRPKGSKIDAHWRVRSAGSQFRIIDVMVEGISMAVTQRDEFAAVIQSRGVASLIKMLRARTEKMTATAR